MATAKRTTAEETPDTDSNGLKEGTPAEEKADRMEKAPKTTGKKPPAKAGKAAAAKQTAVTARAARTAPMDTDQDGEANPSKGKPGAMRPASFFARSAKKSGARTI